MWNVLALVVCVHAVSWRTVHTGLVRFWQGLEALSESELSNVTVRA
jgi:hypothetical protein